MNNNITNSLQGKNLINEFRKLWVQHVMWTRSFVISTAHNLPDLSFVTNRLLRNPKDFAKILKCIYGTQKACIFETLLTEHLMIGASLVNAAKDGNAQDVAKFETQWYANADEIAKFLACINKCWSECEWRNLLYDHLKMTKEEAVLRLNKQYEADIRLYDTIEEEALHMADYMAFGIMKQQCF